jgi:hypothetical protein
VSVFMFPSDLVAQLYPQALGSLFVASYGSQGCDGGILTCLHTGLEPLESSKLSEALHEMESGYLSWYSDWLRAGRPDSTTSRSALRPTQPPIQRQSKAAGA